MTTKELTSLRARLRDDTRALHEHLDAVVSRFDPSTAEGLACFLQMQSLALRAIEPHAAQAASLGALQDLLQRADSDLRQMETGDRPDTPAIAPLHPQAIDYMIAGSRLGTQVLRKRWLAATAPHVRQASAYFSAPSYIDLWTSFCRSTEAMSPRGPVADQIVHDACRLFRLYADFAAPVRVTNGSIHA